MGELYNPFPKLPKNIRQIGDIVEKGEEIARIYEKMTEDGTFSGSYVSVEASI